MSIFGQRFRDGYYDDSGRWRATKHCFLSCGDRCTCRPPMGRYQLPPEEVERRQAEKKAAQDKARQGKPTNPEEMP